MSEIKVNGADKLVNDTQPTNKLEIPLAKLAEITVTDFMTQCLNKVALSEGFKKYEVKVDHGSGVGDGFIGILFKVTIQEKENGSKKQLKIVLKSPPANLARRKEFDAMVHFKRECYLYNKVLPAFVKFQEQKGIKKSEGFFEFPKCYLAEFDEEKDDAVIIMEDLRESGHRMWDKFTPVNYEHAKLVCKALGRFHAMSFALKAQRPEVFNEFKQLTDYFSGKMDDPRFKSYMSSTFEKTESTLDEDDVMGRGKIVKMKAEIKELMKSLTSPTLAEPYNVVGHGDCWTNNFMFKYYGPTPKRIVLLDWQISRYGSPVLDLVHFIFVCTDSAMRAKYFDSLVRTYHKSLEKLLDRLGGNTETQFPFTALTSQLKQFGKFGLVMCALALPTLLMKNEDLPDMDYMAENMNQDDPEQMEEMMKTFQNGSEAFNCRMRGNVLDSIRYGYL